MTELSPEQAKQFAQGWFFDGNQVRASKLCSALDESLRLQLLVANPLMMAIVCYVYDTRPSDDDFIPRRRVDLYDRCVEALIVEWDRSRGVKRDALFSAQEIETVLCHVAYEALQRGHIDFSRNALLTMIRTNLPKANRHLYEDASFLEEVLEHTGLFKVKGHNKVGFLHLTFQDTWPPKLSPSKSPMGAAKERFTKNSPLQWPTRSRMARTDRLGRRHPKRKARVDHDTFRGVSETTHAGTGSSPRYLPARC